MQTTTQAVSFRFRPPRGRLSAFVGLLWYWKGHDLPYSQEWVLPDGSVELVIRLESDRVSDSGVSAPRSRAILIERTVQDELLGIHFKPGGAFPFLGVPLDELERSGVTIGDVWGERQGSELLSRLHDAPDIEGKFRVLEQWLLRIADRPPEHHPAVGFALSKFQTAAGLSSLEAAREVNLSQRRFIELFRDEVGVTPKLFCRIHRFKRVVATLESPQPVDWADVALSCGYFDQSHFIHDFQGFSGLTPTEYLERRHPTAPYHVTLRRGDEKSGAPGRVRV